MVWVQSDTWCNSPGCRVLLQHFTSRLLSPGWLWVELIWAYKGLRLFMAVDTPVELWMEDGELCQMIPCLPVHLLNIRWILKRKQTYMDMKLGHWLKFWAKPKVTFTLDVLILRPGAGVSVCSFTLSVKCEGDQNPVLPVRYNCYNIM